MLDTLQAAETLRGAGLSKKVVDAHVEVLREVIDDKLATKEDLMLLEQRLTIRMYTAQLALFGALAAFMKLFN